MLYTNADTEYAISDHLIYGHQIYMYKITNSRCKDTIHTWTTDVWTIYKIESEHWIYGNFKDTDEAIFTDTDTEDTYTIHMNTVHVGTIQVHGHGVYMNVIRTFN